MNNKLLYNKIRKSINESIPALLEALQEDSNKSPFDGVYSNLEDLTKWLYDSNVPASKKTLDLLDQLETSIKSDEEDWFESEKKRIAKKKKEDAERKKREEEAKQKAAEAASKNVKINSTFLYAKKNFVQKDSLGYYVPAECTQYIYTYGTFRLGVAGMSRGDLRYKAISIVKNETKNMYYISNRFIDENTVYDEAMSTTECKMFDKIYAKVQNYANENGINFDRALSNGIEFDPINDIILMDEKTLYQNGYIYPRDRAKYASRTDKKTKYDMPK